MTKTQEGEGNRRVRGFLTLQRIFTNQHYSRNRKSMIIKHSCHIVPSDAIKALPLGPFKNFKRWSPGWMKYQTNSRNTSVSAPQHYRHMLVQPHLQCSVWQFCVFECSVPWQCRQSGPFKSPWAAGESLKKWLHWSKLNRKNQEHWALD